MRVPDALVRQFYVAGSLRSTPDGWALEAQNPFGDGTITGVGPLALDGIDVPVASIRATVGTAEPVEADAIDRFHPLRLPQGERVRLEVEVEGAALAPGDHELALRLIELNLGALDLRIRDRVAG